MIFLTEPLVAQLTGVRAMLLGKKTIFYFLFEFELSDGHF
jgi:hypothetical protein